MFKRYPYWGWLLACLALYTMATVRHYGNIRMADPERMAQLVSKDLQQQLKAWQTLRTDTALTGRMFNQQLNEQDVQRLIDQPFYLNAFENRKPVFWNNNILPAEYELLYASSRNKAVLPGEDIFFRIYDTVAAPALQRIVVLTVPVARIYPFENEHLRSHWTASALIPAGTEVSDTPGRGFFPVYHAADKVAFYMHVPAGELLPVPPDHYTVWLLVAAILSGFFWLQLIALHMVKKRSPLSGLAFVAGVTAVVRISLYLTGFPLHLQQLELFSPQLYASSRLLPSLGDLLVNNILLVWVCIFIFTQTPYRTFSHKITAPALRYLTAVIIALFMMGYTFYSVHIIRSVVMDSMISFDVSNFYAINTYTVAGLVAIVLTASVYAVLIHILNAQFGHLLYGKSWIKYLFLSASGLLYLHMVLLPQHSGAALYYYSLLLWLLLFAVMLDLKWLSVSRDLLAPRMIFWAVFICVSATMLMQYFNYEKERETRKLFAAKLLQLQDPMTEYLFLDIARELQHDPRIRNFMNNPEQAERTLLNDRIEVLYLKGHLNKYQSDVYFFDAKGKSLYNEGSFSFARLEKRIASSSPVAENYLYFSEKAQDDHSYLARIPIPGEPAADPAGYVFIDLTLKKTGNETVYPELLRPGNISPVQQRSDYMYAIYNNRRMVVQTGDYPFSLSLPDSLRGTAHRFFEHKHMSGLWYPTETQKSIIVIYTPNYWLNLTTIFSYLFGIQLLLILITVIFRVCFSYLTIHNRRIRLGYLTLRRRIHYAMLGVVLASFLIIGIATITFFNTRYRESNRDKLQGVTQMVEHAIRQYITSREATYSPAGMEALMQQTEFRYFIAGLANQYQIDINIFNAAGVLATTSQNAIYDKRLLARIMRADAFQAFRIRQVSMLLQNEQIGALSYLSGYIPLRNDSGNILGYINVPYFASQEELNYQISNILVALINLYSFIFLISSLLAVVITNSLTRSLHMIIARFKHLNLQQNELLDWPYDDEIGLLVKEYNKMVQKVETHALLLVQNERESAWREMARQVAHEIKNPLTPMKLNIQYLQQALKLNHPDVKDLTTRISDSLVEQIDNLSYIASEFSNFAKMPEARPEELELNETLERAAELYLNRNGITVTFLKWNDPLRVFMDKSQLLRVCTNLLQNAIQAIPHGQEGRIEIMLGRERQNVILSFRDNGTGIPASIRSKIFKPYFTTKSSGTGLGLAMTKKIIEFWKGSIWFETAEGNGTIFFVRLPLMEHAE